MASTPSAGADLTWPAGWSEGADARRRRRSRSIARTPTRGREAEVQLAVAPASVVSESFVPNIHSSLTIQAFFRASEPGTKVRVWIEGDSGGKPYVRRTEMTVSTAWEGRAVRALDVPAGGLDSARLRFELMTPGILWIDDLHVPSETTSRSGLLERSANAARGHASLSRRALRRIRPAGELALDPESRAPPRPPGWHARPSPRHARRRIRHAQAAPSLLPYRRTASSGKIREANKENQDVRRV